MFGSRTKTEHQPIKHVCVQLFSAWLADKIVVISSGHCLRNFPIIYPRPTNSNGSYFPDAWHCNKSNSTCPGSDTPFKNAYDSSTLPGFHLVDSYFGPQSSARNSISGHHPSITRPLSPGHVFLIALLVVFYFVDNIASDIRLLVHFLHNHSTSTCKYIIIQIKQVFIILLWDLQKS